MRAYRIPALLFAAFLPLYLPFRSRFLVNWDAVNFALGTHGFDLQHHQPHPPGYIGYVSAGWLLNHLTGDANTSLTLLSVLSVAAAPAAFFLLASLFMQRKYALWSAILLGLSPIVWYYSGVALTYAVELTLGLFFLWAAYLGRQRSSSRLLLAATLLLVVLGAMRPSGALFLMPLWLYTVWPLAWRARLSLAAVLVAGNLLWLVPLMWLSGGVGAFVTVSRELVDLVVVPTSVFGGGAAAPGPLRNLLFLLLGVLIGANFSLLLIGAALAIDRRAFGVLGRHRAFLALWLGPSVLTYVLLHTGQLGYVLLILPALFLLVGLSMEAIASHLRDPADAVRGGRRLGGRRLSPAGGTALLAVGNVAVFLALPPMLGGLVPRQGASTSDRPPVIRPLGWLASALGNAGVGGHPRQFDLRGSDAYWRELTELTRTYDPTQTVILTAAEPGGSFRHLTYYVPGYRVYGLGWDLRGRFGHLFTAFGGTSDYTPRNLRASHPELTLSPEVTTLIVPDRTLQARLPEGAGVRVQLARGPDVVIVSVSPRARVVVRSPADRRGRIEVTTASVQD